MTLKYHFFNYRTIFPLQKVSFLAAKIHIGRKSFLSLSARKKRKRYRRKKCPIIKKIKRSEQRLYSTFSAGRARGGGKLILTSYLYKNKNTNTKALWVCLRPSPQLRKTLKGWLHSIIVPTQDLSVI